MYPESTKTKDARRGRIRHVLHLFPGRFTRPGTAPGDLSHPAGLDETPATLDLVDFDESKYTEKIDCTLEEAREFFDSGNTTWLHVRGAPGGRLLEEIGDAYHLHSLALEDVAHTGQRPKLEAYGDELFAVVAVPQLQDGRIRTAQLSVFLGDSWIVSFFSGEGDPFDAIRRRAKTPDSRIRQRRVDYLFYSLLDTAIDLAFPTMEFIGERIEALEETIFDDPSRDALDEVQHLRRELLLMRRILWPQRDMLNALLRDELEQISESTKPYLRDCYDHSTHALDLVESYREMASSLLEIYLSSLSNRLNDVMKVLTMIATVFIPLSFIVGLYGMNFDRSVSAWNMPELGLRFGYPFVWVVMLIVVVGMLFYFRRRRWL